VPMSSQEIADAASFQTFVNCYLREVDAGTWHVADRFATAADVPLGQGETHFVELVLEALGVSLAFGVSFRSKVGRHTLTAVYTRSTDTQSWRRMDTLSAELLLIDAIYAKRPASVQRLELIGRVVESHQVMQTYVEHQRATDLSEDPGSAMRFIDSEQSTVLGHWLHPTPKSRRGIYGYQHTHYAPELGGRFALRFFAARRALVLQASIADASAEEIARGIACGGHDASGAAARLEALGDGYCVLPLHPLQADWLLHQDYVRALLDADDLVDLGELGPAFTPTSSVRTVYAETMDFMVKLSIPVKITNSLRINLASELGDSVYISKLFRACGLDRDFPEMRPVEDPAYITVALPDHEETGFEVIFRSNAFAERDESEPPRTVHSIAALVQDAWDEHASSKLALAVRTLARARGLRPTDAALVWFEAYFKCAVEAPIRIYDRHGIALEAHQQNVLVELDAVGLPMHAYCRDVQGIGISESFRERTLALVPELVSQEKVFEAEDIVQNGFGYYLFFNQLYSVINRFALDGLLSEDALLEVVRRKLVQMRPQMQRLGTELVDAHLHERSMPFKGNLLTRAADMDELQSENELAVYTQVENPLYAPRTESMTSTRANTEGARP
jgi:siderophore synthetase component